MRNLLFVSIILLGCRSVYDGLTPATYSTDCQEKFKPSYQSAWYAAYVDVMGRHFSGLIFIKELSPTNTRIVFTNEPGIKFFDFEFVGDTFKVHYIISQLNKKPVVQTLRKDFELILMNQLNNNVQAYTNGRERYYRLKSHEESIFWVIDGDCSSLLRMELAGKRKKKVQVEFFGDISVPDSLHLQHFNFNMQLALKRLRK